MAEIQAETLKIISEIQKDTAGVRAEKVMKIGQADADVIHLVEGEKAKGPEFNIGTPRARSITISGRKAAVARDPSGEESDGLLDRQGNEKSFHTSSESVRRPDGGLWISCPP